MKTCTKCKEAKHLEDFCNNKNSKNGKAAWCKACTNEASRIRNLNPAIQAKYNATQRKHRAAARADRQETIDRAQADIKAGRKPRDQQAVDDARTRQKQALERKICPSCYVHKYLYEFAGRVCIRCSIKHSIN